MSFSEWHLFWYFTSLDGVIVLHAILLYFYPTSALKKCQEPEKEDQGQNEHCFIFLAYSRQSGLDERESQAAGPRKWDEDVVKQVPFRAQQRKTNLQSSDQTRSIFGAACERGDRLRSH